jgi:site-specific DNA recombinase
MPSATIRLTAPTKVGAVAVSGDRKRAFIYIRVSTAKQADKDIDPEGYSIPAQRDGCNRRAETLNADVIEEFVDRGESAKSADRPALQRMLRRVDGGDIDYVIVHKIDRLARNRVDDAAIGVALKSAGVQLVSVTENIDDTPSGTLLHGIMASIAEFYSKNLATEILKGTTQKAKAGGTPFLAPIGYLNVRKMIDGREIRTIEQDAERAPRIQWAFEAYATGEWSLKALLEELTDRGLTNRATAKRAERPLYLSQVQKMLRNPYYIGIVAFRGLESEGKHEPLIEPELFDRVQQLLSSRFLAGERNRVHRHYLKGSVFCGRCGSRLTLSQSTGRSAKYLYFICLGRHSKRTKCNLPNLSVDEVESQVLQVWRAQAPLPEKTIDLVRKRLFADLRSERRAAERLIGAAKARVSSIQSSRQSWAEKTARDSIPEDIGREKQNDLARQLVRARAEVVNLERASDDLSDTINLALDLIRDCAEAYRLADDALRRQWNQVFFTALEIDIDAGPKARFTPEIQILHSLAGSYCCATRKEPSRRGLSQPRKALETNENAAEISGRVLVGVGVTTNTLVEVSGLEPPTSTLRT